MGVITLNRDEYDEYMDRVDGDHFDKAGVPISMRQWGALRFNPDGSHTEYPRVGEETIGTAWVSTVWVGMNMGFHLDPPLIFETMIFDESDDDLHQWQDRYATLAEAEEGHRYTVDMVRSIKSLASEPGDGGNEGGDLGAGVDGVHTEHASPQDDEGGD